MTDSTPAPTPTWHRFALPIAVIAFFTAKVWQQRWVSDDGWINIHIVQQILAGNGPVFNAGERVEAGTSPLWLMIQTPLTWLFGHLSLGGVAVWQGLILSVIGLAAMCAAADELAWRRRGRTAAAMSFLPLGILVIALIPPMWDFGTSGLETSLTTAWLGLSFWGLTRVLSLGNSRRSPQLWWPAVVIGLAPLVRPDLTLMGAIFGLVLLLIGPWTVRRIATTIAAAAAFPAVYEIWRMGYYAVLVPNTAVAKDASKDWTEQGLNYLADYAETHGVALMVAICLVVALAHSLADRGDWRAHLVRWAPVVAGLAHGAYVVRVGGDFMHARFLLPATIALVLPVAAIPMIDRWNGRVATAIVALVGVWGTAWVADPAPKPFGFAGIVDERAYWTAFVPSHKTLDEADWVKSQYYDDGHAMRVRAASGESAFVERLDQAYKNTAMQPARPGQFAAAFPALGSFGLGAGTRVTVVDPIGLTDVVNARVRPEPGTVYRVGHYYRPPVWRIAKYAAPGPNQPKGVDDARAALRCGDLAEIIAATEEPLTAGRFLRNITLAPRLTGLTFSEDPAKARAQLCG